MVGLGQIVRESGRMGCVGFGGPPAHIALLRELCVERRAWMGAQEFEDANAACGLLPGPASTQLAIYCAHRVVVQAGLTLARTSLAGRSASRLARALAYLAVGAIVTIAAGALVVVALLACGRSSWPCAAPPRPARFASTRCPPPSRSGPPAPPRCPPSCGRR